MLKNRIKSWLLAWGLGAGLAIGGLSSEALGQVDPPFVQHEIREPDMHIFAPADLSTFDSRPHPNTGYWIDIGYVQMWTSAPDRAVIGNPITAARFVIDGTNNGTSPIFPPNLRREMNTTDTSQFGSERRSGHRTSIGYMGDDSGWSATVFDMGGFDSEFDANNAEIILFDPLGGLTGFIDINGDGFDDDLDGDTVFGRSGIDTTGSGTPDTFSPPDISVPFMGPDGVIAGAGDSVNQPLFFTTLQVRTEVESWGVELNRDLRLGSSSAGTLDVSYGVRYFNFDEEFLVTGRGGMLFTDTFFETGADNDLLGPKIAARWFRTSGRMTWSFDTSFTAALNFQSIRQNGQFAGNTGFSNLFSQNVFFNNTAHETEFAPIIEMGINARYQITSKFYANVGWRGMFMDNIARPQTMVNYTFPTMGIIAGNNRQELFIHGLQLGISFNH